MQKSRAHFKLCHLSSVWEAAWSWHCSSLSQKNITSLQPSTTEVLSERQKGDHKKLNIVEKLTAVLTTLDRDYFHGLLCSFLKMVNSETKSGNSLGFCTNHKALNAWLISFPPFLFQGSGGSEVPLENCSLQSIAQSEVNRFSANNNSNNIPHVA